jgi:hypothetical protein
MQHASSAPKPSFPPSVNLPDATPAVPARHSHTPQNNREKQIRAAVAPDPPPTPPSSCPSPPPSPSKTRPLFLFFFIKKKKEQKKEPPPPPHKAPPAPPETRTVYRLALATRSVSSFFLIAYELEEPLAALIISSARHSAMVLTLRKDAARAPVARR